MDPTARDRLLARLAERPAEWTHYVEDLAAGDRDFGLWLHIVDRRMLRTIGLRHSDLPDQPWREEYDAGTDPVDYADDVMRAELT